MKGGNLGLNKPFLFIKTALRTDSCKPQFLLLMPHCWLQMVKTQSVLLDLLLWPMIVHVIIIEASISVINASLLAADGQDAVCLVRFIIVAYDCTCHRKSKQQKC